MTKRKESLSGNKKKFKAKKSELNAEKIRNIRLHYIIPHTFLKVLESRRSNCPTSSSKLLVQIRVMTLHQ